MDLSSPIVAFVLLLARVSGFFVVAPIFSAQSIPLRVRVGVALLVTAVLATVSPGYFEGVGDHWLAVLLTLLGEVLCGLVMGLAVALVFSSVRQVAQMLRRQMALGIASVIDPLSGEKSQPLGLLMEVSFSVFFLVTGGHHLLLLLLDRSYAVFPVSHPPSLASMAEATIQAGALMLLFALKLAAPFIAGFLLLAVVLGILARVLPEMNVLFASLPLRIGMGLFMAAAIMPGLHAFTRTLADWMNGFLTS